MSRLHAMLQTVEACSQHNRLVSICVVEHMMAKCSIKGLQENVIKNKVKGYTPLFNSEL
ncbi:MAG: hypothetical protein VX649_01195 [Pseudomonadota bacterium]|nr:hypothetical protein [Pseudomonadota bacterium]